MRAKIWISAAALTCAGAIAWAHSGAAGEVEQRMAGMSAMQKQIRALVPIMRGRTDYSPDTIRAAADIVISHSGETLTALFPEGSNAAPSEALDAIWDDWDEFTDLANALAAAAEGMKRAADNGLGELGPSMRADGRPGTAPDPDKLAEMPVNAGFMAMTQTCSGCHSKFRAKRN